MINMSMIADTIPNEIKETLVTLIYKEGDKLNVSGYRPVSISFIKNT